MVGLLELVACLWPSAFFCNWELLHSIFCLWLEAADLKGWVAGGFPTGLRCTRMHEVLVTSRTLYLAYGGHSQRAACTSKRELRVLRLVACRDQLRSTRRSLGEGNFLDLLPKAETPFTFEALSKARSAQVSTGLPVSPDKHFSATLCCTFAMVAAFTSSAASIIAQRRHFGKGR